MQTQALGHIRERDLADEAPKQPDRGVVIASLHEVRAGGAAWWPVAIKGTHRFQPGK